MIEEIRQVVLAIIVLLVGLMILEWIAIFFGVELSSSSVLGMANFVAMVLLGAAALKYLKGK